VIGAVGVSRLQAVGDAGPIRAVSGADEWRAVLGKAEEHLLDAVVHRNRRGRSSGWPGDLRIAAGGPVR